MDISQINARNEHELIALDRRQPRVSDRRIGAVHVWHYTRDTQSHFRCRECKSQKAYYTWESSCINESC